MHFSLRKTFSLLNTHRRTRSDAIPEDHSANPPPRVQSWSLTRIEELIFGSSTQVAPKPFYVSVAQSPSLYQQPAPSQRLVLHTNVIKSDAEPSTLESRLATLQAENSQLKEKIATLEFDARICEEELAKFRSDYYAERFKANVRRRLVSVSEAKSQAQDDQLERAEAFILSLIEVDLHQPVLSEAWQAVKAGLPSDDALVQAIKKAAAIPGTSWSTIISAVTGPQTRNQNLFPIPLTLKARKDLNTTMKATMFWKSPARADRSPDKTATPPSSHVSSTGGDTADHGNQTAVGDFVNKLREGELPTRSPASSKRGTQERAPNHTSGRARIPASSLNSKSHSVPLPGPPSPDRVQEYIPTPPSHAADLAPLASQTFKDEHAACHHSPRRLRLSPSNQRRSVFGKVDINRNVQRLSSLKKATDKHGAKPSAKALGKRKAIMVKKDIQLSAVDNPSPNKSNHPAVLPNQVSYSTLQRSGETSNALHAVLDTGSIPNPYVTAPAGSAQTAQPLCDQGTLLPERALLSLERICAGFSSGSLGSLAMISEDSEANRLGTQSTVSPTKLKQEEPVSRTPPIFRKSVLPVLKVRRVVSMSSKPFITHRPPDMTAAHTTEFPKRLVHTNTSPLRVTKRAKPSTSDTVPRKPHTMGPTSAGSITRGFSGGHFGSKRMKPAKGTSPIAF